MNEIIHGYCLEIMKDISDKSIDMILCDLPYGTVACKWDKKIDLEKLFNEYKRIITDIGSICLFAMQPFASELIFINKDIFKYCWYWEKSKGGNFALTGFQPFKVIEEICVFSKAASTFVKSGQNMIYNPQKISIKEYIRKIYTVEKKDVAIHFKSERPKFKKYNEKLPRNLLYAATDSDDRVHPTQKPVSICEYLIKTYTNENMTVLDNCIGSGTTAIACINTGRNYIGIEKEKKYVDIANERIKNHKRKNPKNKLKEYLK